MTRAAITRRSIICGAAALLVVGMLTACGGGDGTPSTPTDAAGRAVRVAVDTDLASDDLVALAFLLSSPDAEVVAVTVSGTGEVRCPQGLRVVRGLLALTGDDDVPVACGRPTPLAGDHAFPTEWRDAADDGWDTDLPEVAAPAVERTAVELLSEALEPGGVTLLTLGPLTNAADAFRADPGLAGRVASIMVMGGALDVAGNVPPEGAGSPTAEWNVFVDPTAVGEVLASGARVVMVGLDATNRAPISGDFLELLGVNAHTDAAKLVDSLIRNNPQVYTGEAYFWDPLAAAIAVDPGLASTRPARISVVTTEGADSGRTLRDPRGGHRAAVAADPDVPAFEEQIIRALDGVEPGTPLADPPTPVADVAIRYDGTNCAYDGPAAIRPGRLRFTFASDEPGWFGAVAHLDGTRRADEVIEWIEAHPGEPGVPGIDQTVAFVAAGGAQYTNAAPGEELVACGDDAGAIVPATVIAVR
jgi:pyrimidine-specific ribonucleoside hydrolase